jgi:hypothetical protein
VIITASTKSNEPVHQAATMCRKRGRIVLVGVTGLELSRADFYEKELSFQVSCSYGPGRYDPAYEEQGQDYPFGFVRWTEQRNFEAILGLMASGAIDVSSLISHRFEIGDAVAAYEVLSKENPLGIVLTYPEATESSSARNVSLAATPKTNDSAKPVVTMIGAGNYASQMLIPALQASGVQLATLVSAGGVSSGGSSGLQRRRPMLAVPLAVPIRIPLSLRPVTIATQTWCARHLQPVNMCSWRNH